VHNRIPVWVRVKDGGTLLRGAAWDIEREPLSFKWTVVRQPDGGAAQLEPPDKAACKVSGMTVPGDYVFRLDVSDPANAAMIREIAAKGASSRFRKVERGMFDLTDRARQ
jgi:hypothetical protein